jgi:hypothetical protein
MRQRVGRRSTDDLRGEAVKEDCKAVPTGEFDDLRYLIREKDLSIRCERTPHP